jgi:hypothetical protein
MKLTYRVTESLASSTIKEPKATPRGRTSSGLPTDRPTDLENAFDLCMRDLVLDRHSITTLSVASLHLREVISVNGRRRRSGQRNSSNRTRCVTCSQRRNLQRLLFAVNGQRQASLHPRRQAIYKQRRAPHTRIQVMRLCLKGMLAATWANTNRVSRRQARDFAKLYSTASKSSQRIQSFAMIFSTTPAKDYGGLMPDAMPDAVPLLYCRRRYFSTSVPAFSLSQDGLNLRAGSSEVAKIRSRSTRTSSAALPTSVSKCERR